MSQNNILVIGTYSMVTMSSLICITQTNKRYYPFASYHAAMCITDGTTPDYFHFMSDPNDEFIYVKTIVSFSTYEAIG